MSELFIASWELFANAFAIEFQLDPDHVTRDVNLVNDLGFDSMAFIHLQLLLEEATGHLFPDDVVPVVVTIGDAYEYYTTIVVNAALGT